MSDADQADKNKGFTKTLTIGYVNENTFYNEKGIDPMKFATGLIFRQSSCHRKFTQLLMKTISQLP